MEAGRQVWISPNAAGWGWFVDASASSNQAFPATPGSPAEGKMDLLSVVNHELGHVLGLEDSPDLMDVMGETLAPGVRRLPAAGDLTPHLVQATTPATAGAADPILVTPRANIFRLPSQATAPATSDSNPASPAVPPSLGLALLPAGRRDPATNLPLTAREQIGSAAILDRLFAAVASEPLDQDLFSDPLVP
jgi:hypothetical protein